MVRKMRLQLMVAAICFLSSCSNEEISPSIHIASYPQDKIAAISFTFDDGCPSAYTRIAPMFDQFGYKASFFVIAGNIIDWAPWVDLYQRDFEIGNHSYSHLNLKNVYDTAVINHEVNDSYDLIAKNLGKAPFSYAHTFHTSNEVVNSIIKKRHHASRLNPRNFSEWEAWPGNTREDDIEAKINNVMSDRKWYVACAHGIGDCWGPIRADLLRNVLTYVKENEKNLHVDTFEHLAKYKIERHNVKIITTESVESKVIELRSNLDESIYDFPLTLVLNNFLYKNPKITSPNSEITVERTHSGGKILINAKINSIIYITWGSSAN